MALGHALKQAQQVVVDALPGQLSSISGPAAAPARFWAFLKPFILLILLRCAADS